MSCNKKVPGLISEEIGPDFLFRYESPERFLPLRAILYLWGRDVVLTTLGDSLPLGDLYLWGRDAVLTTVGDSLPQR